MRRYRPKQKKLRSVKIPAELSKALGKAFELIEDADEPHRFDYDDAIQVGPICGGRTGAKSRPYEFTYFPTGDTTRGRWYLRLTESEIEDIGDGRISKLPMHCCTSKNCRTKFSKKGSRCDFCDYFEDDPVEVAKQRALEKIAEKAKNKREFVAAYVKHFPDASTFSLFTDLASLNGANVHFGQISFPEEATKLLFLARGSRKSKSLTSLSDKLRRLAMTYPCATETSPTTIGVRGREFLGLSGSDVVVFIVFKLPISGRSALSHSFVKAASSEPLRSENGVVIRLLASDIVPFKLLSDWLDESYRAVAPEDLVEQLTAKSSLNA
jgi:hypothetical protein